MAARNEEKLAATVENVQRDVPGANVRPLILDLADLESVRTGGRRGLDVGPLNLLVDNAGVMATPWNAPPTDSSCRWPPTSSAISR